MSRLNISFAGAGNVAGILCREMYRSGIKILQVVSETEKEGKPLAGDCNALWSDQLSFSSDNQVIIVAVPDHRLSEVLASIECPGDCVVAHTAGSFGLGIFPDSICRRGVFYPLQTFTRGRKIKIDEVPFLLEASDGEAGEILQNLVTVMGAKSTFIDSARRKILHLAAVFVCNFTNYMLTAGDEIVSKADLSFVILEPLIKETIAKALETGPGRSQTGPAFRNDLNTVEKHLKLLSFSPELQNIYRELTESIIRHYKTN